MKKKIVGIFVCMLLITTAALPVAMSMNNLKDGKDASMLNKKYVFSQKSGQPIILTVGECDNFTLPYEPTDPSQILLNWIDKNYEGPNGSRDCDENRENQYWAHTFNFTGLCNGNIVGATFNITVKNLDYNFNNDALALGCVEDNTYSWSDGIYGRLDIVYGIQVGEIGTINLDLSGDYPSFFNDMVNHGYLDVIVQDDSMVDCATLTIWCDEGDPSIDVEKLAWDEKNQEWVDADTENEALDVPICNDVTFKIVIHNDGNCPIKYINISDHMHDSLKFISADPEPDDYVYDPPEYRMWWYFPGPLMPCDTIEITLIAHVEGPKCSYDYNWVLVGALCEHGDYVEDEDTCWVHATGDSRPFYRPFLQFLESHPNMFPLLQKLLQRLGL